MALNSVQMSGRLTGDPEIINLKSGSRLGTLSIAHNRRWLPAGIDRATATQDDYREEVTYLDVKVWRDYQIDQIAQLAKGDMVTVSGRLDQQTWETEEGARRSKHVLTVTSTGHDIFKVEPFARVGGGASGGGNAGGRDNALDSGVADDDFLNDI